MDIRHLTEDYAVTPQIAPEDVPAIVEAGFKSVICNRPDDEVPADICAAEVQAAVTAAGLAWIDNPFATPAMTPDHVAAQKDALSRIPPPVLAYCRSGTRCTMVWALAQAGDMPVDQIVSAAAEAGYDVSNLRPAIEAMARG